MAAMTLLCGTASVSAKSEKQMATIVFQTDLHCQNCGKKVMNTIPYEKGVKDVQVDVPSKTVKVTFDTSKTDRETLLKAFESIRVKVFKAEPVAESK